MKNIQPISTNLATFITTTIYLENDKFELQKLK